MIAEGADADLVLWDPDERRTIEDADMLSGSGYSIYAGWGEVDVLVHRRVARTRRVGPGDDALGEVGDRLDVGRVEEPRLLGLAGRYLGQRVVQPPGIEERQRRGSTNNAQRLSPADTSVHRYWSLST